MRTPKPDLQMENKGHYKTNAGLGFVLAVVSFLGCFALLGTILSLLIWPLMAGILKPYGLQWTFWQSACAGGMLALLALSAAIIKTSTSKEITHRGHRRFSD